MPDQTSPPFSERLEQELRSQVMELETKKTMLDGFDIGLEDSQSLMAEYIKRFKALYNVFIARSTELYVFPNDQTQILVLNRSPQTCRVSRRIFRLS